jgi:hypothetical protein
MATFWVSLATEEKFLGVGDPSPQRHVIRPPGDELVIGTSLHTSFCHEDRRFHRLCAPRHQLGMTLPWFALWLLG